VRRPAGRGRAGRRQPRLAPAAAQARRRAGRGGLSGAGQERQWPPVALVCCRGACVFRVARLAGGIPPEAAGLTGSAAPLECVPDGRGNGGVCPRKAGGVRVPGVGGRPSVRAGPEVVPRVKGQQANVEVLHIPRRAFAHLFHYNGHHHRARFPPPHALCPRRSGQRKRRANCWARVASGRPAADRAALTRLTKGPSPPRGRRPPPRRRPPGRPPRRARRPRSAWRRAAPSGAPAPPGAFSLTGAAGGRMMGARPWRMPARRTVANAEFSAPAARPNQSLQCIGAPGTSATTGQARGGRAGC